MMEQFAFSILARIDGSVTIDAGIPVKDIENLSVSSLGSMAL